MWKVAYNLLKCSNKDHPLYITPRPTVSAVITNNNGHVFLTQRANEPFRKKWELPGGFVNLGEDPDRALIREIKEELDLDIKIIRPFWVFSGAYPYKDIEYETCNIYYLVDLESNNFTPNEEILGANYFKEDNLPEIGFDIHVKILKMFFQKKNL